MPRFNPFQQNGDVLPPEQVRFLDVHVEPWPDRRRVRVHLTIHPFQQPSDLKVAILDLQGREVSHIAIIENIYDHFVVTMHLKNSETQSDYRLEATLSYQDKGQIARTSCTFQIPSETIS